MGLPNIAVMGAGALGCFFGGRLALAGATVTLIGRPGHVEAIKRRGLIFESGGKKKKIKLAATTEPDGVRDARIVLICVKSADSDSAAAAIAPHLAADAALISLQNGVGNAERIQMRANRPVAAGLVYTAAAMKAPGHVLHTGGGRIVIGAVKNCGVSDALLGELGELFRTAGIAAEISSNIETELWSKLVANCAYNAACALTGKRYGAMVAMPEIRALMRETAEEVIALARAKGVTMPDGAIDTMFRIAETMPMTMSSTAQDIAKGRATEIDFLNGYIAREGEALGIATPVNRALNALVKLREKA
jgi:2-dehydropantoate 2-reductase